MSRAEPRVAGRRRIASSRPRRRADEAAGGVRVVDVATRATRYLGRGTDAAWSPDGRALAVTTNDEGSSGAPECGTVRRLTPGSGERLATPRTEPCDRFLAGLRTVGPSSSSDRGTALATWRRLRALPAFAMSGASDLLRTAGRRLLETLRVREPARAGRVADRRSRAAVPASVANGDWRCPR